MLSINYSSIFCRLNYLTIDIIVCNCACYYLSDLCNWLFYEYIWEDIRSLRFLVCFYGRHIRCGIDGAMLWFCHEYVIFWKVCSQFRQNCVVCQPSTSFPCFLSLADDYITGDKPCSRVHLVNILIDQDRVDHIITVMLAVWQYIKAIAATASPATVASDDRWRPSLTPVTGDRRWRPSLATVAGERRWRSSFSEWPA